MRATPVMVFALALGVSAAVQAQSTPAASADSISSADAPAPKKKGLFGKVKGLAKNKIVKTVAKAALCTAVPGGQVIAGALDAAENKDAAGAAGAAAGLSGGGGNCMPGLAGAVSPGGAGAAAIGAGTGAVGSAVSGVGVPGQPSTGMPGMAMSPEQLKQMQEQYGKMGMDTAQLRAMQQMMANMPGAAQPQEGESAGGAPGAPALSREKGRMLVRNLPWAPGSAAVAPGGELAFAMAMHEVALAIPATAGRYKIEARVENQGGKSQSRALAKKRATAVLQALTREGIAGERLTVADGGSDKDPRIIVSEGK